MNTTEQNVIIVCYYYHNLRAQCIVFDTKYVQNIYSKKTNNNK